MIKNQVCEFTVSQELNVALFYFRLKIYPSTATSENFPNGLQLPGAVTADTKAPDLTPCHSPAPVDAQPDVPSAYANTHQFPRHEYPHIEDTNIGPLRDKEHLDTLPHQYSCYYAYKQVRVITITSTEKPFSRADPSHLQSSRKVK